MNDERRIERMLDDWLVSGPTELPDRVLDDALDLIDQTAQRRPLGLLRGRRMTDSVKILLGAAAVFALVVGGGLLGRVVSGPVDQGVAAATPAPAATTAPAPASSTFTSELYRYGVTYPATWQVADPLGDIVSFNLPTVGTLVQVVAADTTSTGGLYWPWGGIRPVTGADLESFAGAAVDDLQAQGLDVVFDRPTVLGGQSAWRIDVAELDIGEGPMPATIVL
ncbi:MAG: hypothetical protein ACRDIL_18105, partial [Candidatus Limnocylindrales bacterium]